MNNTVTDDRDKGLKLAKLQNVSLLSTSAGSLTLNFIFYQSIFSLIQHLPPNLYDKRETLQLICSACQDGYNPWSICTLPRRPSDNPRKRIADNLSAYWHKNIVRYVSASWPMTLLRKESVELGVFYVFGQNCINSTQNIKMLPSIALPCTDLDISLKGTLVNLKYTRPKLILYRVKCQSHWSCCWCHMQPINLGDGHSANQMNLISFYTFSPRRTPGIIQTHIESPIHPLPQDQC